MPISLPYFQIGGLHNYSYNYIVLRGDGGGGARSVVKRQGSQTRDHLKPKIVMMTLLGNNQGIKFCFEFVISVFQNIYIKYAKSPIIICGQFASPFECVYLIIAREPLDDQGSYWALACCVFEGIGKG